MFKSINKKVVTALFGVGLGLGMAAAPATASCIALQCVKEYRACVAAGEPEELCAEQRIYCNDICYG